MSNKKFLRMSRKILSGDFEFKQHIGNIVQFQETSYKNFLQKNAEPSQRQNIGLEKILRNFFPINHVKSKIKIEYSHYEISNPRMTPDDCVLRGLNYGGSIKIFLKIINLVNEETKIIESSVGEIPLMTDKNTFIINGHERVFISQIQKNPGVLFSKEMDTSTMRKYSVAKIQPEIGSWIHFKLDKTLTVSIDKKKKFGVITFLLCFSKKLIDQNIYPEGYDLSHILDQFNPKIHATLDGEFWKIPFNATQHNKLPLRFNIFKKNEQVAKRNETLSPELIKKLSKEKYIHIPVEDLTHCFLAEDIYDETTGKIFCEVGSNPTLDQLNILKPRQKVAIYNIDNNNPGYILDTLAQEQITTKDEALNLWSEIIKIGSHYGAMGLSWIFNTRFTNKRYYDLGKNGRKRLNGSLKVETTQETYLVFEDVVETIKQLILVHHDKRKEDEIDNLANKKFFGPGEILENYFRLGLVKFEKNLKDRVYNFDIDTKKVADFFNLRTCLYFVLEAFYKAAQMHDENNQLSKFAQLRKINSAGQPGKERIAAGLRETNKSKFGRMCAVQTPEGKKNGIVEHLALYAQINEEGMITAPYHIVTNGIASTEVTRLTPLEEENKIISSKNLYTLVTENGKSYYKPNSEYVVARDGDQTTFVHNTRVDLINIAHNQIFSISSALIPFPGHNDAYRLLSGSNMNTQATPLISPENPFIGTGMEEYLSEKIVAKNPGVVKYVDGTRIIVETNDADKVLDFYSLIFNKKTNNETAVLHKPTVDIGDVVEKGEILADGFSSLNGELALGKNLLVAYMSNSYCFEDAIVLSQRIIDEDLLTSVHIQSHVCTVYETRNGPEINTADIPRAHPETVRHLDDAGIVNVGTRVQGGQILVGKVTPSSKEADISMEYKLLNIIFGEKASECTDNSLRLPNGVDGFVSKVRVVTREGVEKDDRAILEDNITLKSIEQEYNEKLELTQRFLQKKMDNILKNTSLKFAGSFEKWKKANDKKLSGKTKESVEKLYENYNKLINEIEQDKKKKINTIKFGYELPEGVLKLITIDISTKSVIEAGDKLAGRYGNKGVISTIWRKVDMPYMEDGTPVDMVVTSLSLMGRMNIGQIMETVLGYGIISLQKRLYKLLVDYEAGVTKSLERIKEVLSHVMELKDLVETPHNTDFANCKEEEIIEIAYHIKDHGIKFALEQFKELEDKEIEEFLKNMGGNSTGKIKLYDGRNGEPFVGEVLVGYQFILKLCHLVSRKLHARSIGPYSLVNQQPLGGKARSGGQKIGEMEVWSLEAHGAACNIQELFLSKSDDDKKRKQIYEALLRVVLYSLIIMSKSNDAPVGVSFKLLMYELRAAGLDLYLEDEQGNRISGGI